MKNNFSIIGPKQTWLWLHGEEQSIWPDVRAGSLCCKGVKLLPYDGKTKNLKSKATSHDPEYSASIYWGRRSLLQCFCELSKPKTYFIAPHSIKNPIVSLNSANCQRSQHSGSMRDFIFWQRQLINQQSIPNTLPQQTNEKQRNMLLEQPFSALCWVFTTYSKKSRRANVQSCYELLCTPYTKCLSLFLANKIQLFELYAT